MEEEKSEYGIIIFNFCDVCFKNKSVFIGERRTFFDGSGVYFVIPGSDEVYYDGEKSGTVKDFIPIPFFDDLTFIINREQRGSGIEVNDIFVFMDTMIQRLFQEMQKKTGEK